MKIGLKKKCKHRRKLFTPDRRVWKRQKTCSSATCQRRRKKRNNQAFKDKNPGYWKNRYSYIQQWREENPVYQEKWRLGKKEKEKKKSRSEIQAEKARNYIDSIEEKLIALREIQAELFLPSLDTKRPKPVLSFQTQ
jgi:hypothetical protein